MAKAELENEKHMY